MKEEILILTNSMDGRHTESVIALLPAENTFRLDVDEFARGEIDFVFEQTSKGTTTLLRSGQRAIQLNDIKSVWYRRPNQFDLDINDTAQKEYAEKELVMFFKNLYALLPQHAFWMNHPEKLFHARRKLDQLGFARSQGIPVPATMVTNRPEKVMDFYNSCDGRIVFKALYNEFLSFGSRVLNVPTTLIGQEHLDKLDTLRKLPGLFQAFVNKAYEIRVTIVGTDIFPVKISPIGDLDLADWRHPYAGASLRYEPVRLPREISNFCLSLLQHYGLSFGAVDFVVDKSGTYWFLEINPNGQWYWIQDLTGASIAEAIADNLNTGRR